MRKGKYTSRGAASKSMALVLSLILLVGCVVGGTIAWLTDSSVDVKNTFTDSDVEITLKESPIVDENGDNVPESYGTPAEDTDNEYAMIPGYTYTKDPVVTVEADSEACWLFVKFEEKNNPSAYLDYTSTLTTANGWEKGDGTSIPSNVWYREVPKSTKDQSWHLLLDDTITVNGAKVTKENMAEAAKAELVYYAYACQLMKNNTDKFTAAEAWANISTAG